MATAFLAVMARPLDSVRGPGQAPRQSSVQAPRLSSGQASPDTSQPYLMSANTMKAQLLGQDKVTRLLGRVEIVHGSTVLRGDSAWVSTLRQQAEVWGRVSLTDRDIQMTGRRACYYKKIGKAVMHGDPVAKDQQWTLSADSLAYFRETSRSEAYGNVRIADSSGRQQARADFGQYWHQKGYGMLDGSPKLEIREGQGATVRTITSHKMEVYRQGNLAIAKGEVRFVQDSLTVPSPNVGSMGTPSNSGLQASCGLAAYYRDQGRLVLEERPRVWQPGAEMEARVMTLSLNGDTVKSLEAFDSVALRQFTATDEDTDLIRCDSLWAEFQDGRISQAKTCGDVWSLYHQFDQGRKRGSNIVQSRVMEFYFKEGRLARINIPAEARGAFFGEEVP